MSAPTLYLLSDPHIDGLAIRMLQYSDADDLPDIVTDDGDEPYAEATTNRGTFKCAVGTFAWKPGVKDMKELGPTGWEEA